MAGAESSVSIDIHIGAKGFEAAVAVDGKTEEFKAVATALSISVNNGKITVKKNEEAKREMPRGKLALGTRQHVKQALQGALTKLEEGADEAAASAAPAAGAASAGLSLRNTCANGKSHVAVAKDGRALERNFDQPVKVSCSETSAGGKKQSTVTISDADGTVLEAYVLNGDWRKADK